LFTIPEVGEFERFFEPPVALPPLKLFPVPPPPFGEQPYLVWFDAARQAVQTTYTRASRIRQFWTKLYLCGILDSRYIP